MVELKLMWAHRSLFCLFDWSWVNVSFGFGLWQLLLRIFRFDSALDELSSVYCMYNVWLVVVYVYSCFSLHTSACLSIRCWCAKKKNPSLFWQCVIFRQQFCVRVCVCVCIWSEKYFFSLPLSSRMCLPLVMHIRVTYHRVNCHTRLITYYSPLSIHTSYVYLPTKFEYSMLLQYLSEYLRVMIVV